MVPSTVRADQPASHSNGRRGQNPGEREPTSWLAGSTLAWQETSRAAREIFRFVPTMSRAGRFERVGVFKRRRLSLRRELHSSERAQHRRLHLFGPRRKVSEADQPLRDQGHATKARNEAWTSDLQETKTHRRAGVRLDQSRSRFSTVFASRNRQGECGMESDLLSDQPETHGKSIMLDVRPPARPTLNSQSRLLPTAV